MVDLFTCDIAHTLSSDTKVYAVDIWEDAVVQNAPTKK